MNTARSRPDKATQAPAANETRGRLEEGLDVDIEPRRTAVDVPDYASLARTADAQREIDQRVAFASKQLTRQVVVLALVTAAEEFVRRTARRRRRRARR